MREDSQKDTEEMGLCKVFFCLFSFFGGGGLGGWGRVDNGYFNKLIRFYDALREKIKQRSFSVKKDYC